MGPSSVSLWDLCWLFCGLHHIMSNGYLRLSLFYPLDCEGKASRHIWLLSGFLGTQLKAQPEAGDSEC